MVKELVYRWTAKVMLVNRMCICMFISDMREAHPTPLCILRVWGHPTHIPLCYYDWRNSMPGSVLCIMTGGTACLAVYYTL